MQKINVLGYGVMARQIAALMYCIGCEVTVWSHKRIDENVIKRDVRMVGRIIADGNKGKINFSRSLGELENNVTIESVVEDVVIKKQLYDALRDRIDGYFTNSSSILPAEIGENVGVIHFYNPISIRLVEVVCDKKNIDFDRLINSLKLSGFNFICVNDNYGYVGNFILFKEISSVFELIEVYGYSVEDVQKAYDALWSGKDIFKVVDLIGIDVVRSIMKKYSNKLPEFYFPKLIDRAPTLGILGRKNKTSIMNMID